MSASALAITYSLVLVGAMLNPVESLVAVYVYCVGALMFVAMQMLESYEGDSFVVRRLRRQQIVGGLLLLLSGVAMFGQEYHIMYIIFFTSFIDLQSYA